MPSQRLLAATNNLKIAIDAYVSALNLFVQAAVDDCNAGGKHHDAIDALLREICPQMTGK